MARDEGGKGELSQAHVAKLELISQEVKKQRPIIETLLGGDVGWDAFVRATTVALRGNPYILTMPAESLVQACFEAAQDRLLPDGVQGAIVPRYNWKTNRQEAKWQPMYQGLLLVAKKYAGVLNIDCELVFEGEHFKSIKGTSPRIEHEQDVSKFNLDKIVAAYAVVWFKDGTWKSEVMDRAMLEDVRNTSEAVKKGKPTPWTSPFRGEMYRKTVMRRIWKWVPVTGENAQIVHNAITRVDGEHAGMPIPDTLAAAGIEVPRIAGPDPLPSIANAMDTGDDKLQVFRDKLAELGSAEAIEVWLMQPKMQDWMHRCRMRQQQRYGQIRDLIDTRMGELRADEEKGEAECLAIAVPANDDASEWKDDEVCAYDRFTLPEAYVQWWRDVLNKHPDQASEMLKRNMRKLQDISERGQAYDLAALEVSRLVDVTKAWLVKREESRAAKEAKAVQGHDAEEMAA